MVSLTIDGVRVEVPENSTVLDAARKANIDYLAVYPDFKK